MSSNSDAIDGKSVLQRLNRYNKSTGHRQIHFDEYLCKHILEYFVRLDGIRVSDRPDLRFVSRGKSVGIEVVNSAPSEYHMLWKNVDLRDGCLYLRKNLNKSTLAAIDRYFPKCDDGSGERKLNLGLLDFRRAVPHVVKCVKVTFDHKVKKSSGYDDVDNVWLFIYCQSNVMFSVSDLEDLAAYFLNGGGYSKVFLFDEFMLYSFCNGAWEGIYCGDEFQKVIDDTLCELSCILPDVDS